MFVLKNQLQPPWVCRPALGLGSTAVALLHRHRILPARPATA
ncbi:hypothetical protein [Streptomyces sp. ML-6]|nr:hypothetical protein [Streptomyces sp. ML-6]MDK0523251.1 hypothetical protein [Streptomyces sp. ML-6]